MGRARAMTTDADINELVKSALISLARNSGSPVKLKAKAGQSDGLFPATAAGEKGIERSTTGDGTLISLQKHGQTQFGTFTPLGVAQATGHLAEDESGQLLLDLTERLEEGDRNRFLEEVYRHLGGRSAEVRERYSALARRRTEEDFALQRRVKAEQYRGLIAERTAAREQLQARLHLMETELDGMSRLLSEIEAAVPPREGRAQPEPRKPTRANLPITLEDQDFQEQLAREMIYSWQEAISRGNDDARELLEGALQNVPGMGLISQIDEELSFDAAYHVCDTFLKEGLPVRTIRPGWLLHRGEGELLLEKALVQPRG